MIKSPFSCQDIIATGGVDTNAVLFDRSSGQILSTLSGHSKKVLPFHLLVFDKSNSMIVKIGEKTTIHVV